MVRQHNGRFAAAQRFDDFGLTPRMLVGAVFAFTAHAACLHHRINALISAACYIAVGGTRQLLADVTTRQIIAADCGVINSKPSPAPPGRLNMFPNHR